MDVAVEFAHATLAHGRHVALAGVTLQLPRGRTTALIGPNGSGKSTLLLAISGLLEPTSGTVVVHGHPATRETHCVAHVLQSTANAHLPITVGEVVRMGRYARVGMFRRLGSRDAASVRDAMERMEITDLADRQMRELSGGQRQRALVAQGLAQDADILLLDEPATGLDLVSQNLITQAMKAEKDAGRTVIVSTHDLNEAGRTDHVVLLNGRVVASGDPDMALSPVHLETAYGRQLVTFADHGPTADLDVHHHTH